MGKVVLGRGAAAFVLLVAFGCALAVAAVAPAQAASAASSSPSPSPTIVSQITSKDTMYSNTYQLSDGTYQARIYSQPIRFKNAQGAWQSFDTSLVAVGPSGVYHAADTPVGVTIGSSSAGSPPAQLTAAGYTVTWSLQNASAALALAPTASAASYFGAAANTTLSYRVLDWGVEQSLTLASAAAPNSFTCTLSHPGLTMAQDPTSGQWSLFAPGNPDPIFNLSGINVTDASADAQGNPAACAAAAMSVSPGNGQSTLTYTVPRSWLADPARVYPVTIDPTITRQPPTGDSSPTYCDTFVNDTPPSGTHGTATNLLCGDDSTYGHCRDLISFDLSSLSGDYISSAIFYIDKFYQGSSSPTIELCPATGRFTYGSSWTSLGCSRNTFSSPPWNGSPIFSGTIPVGWWSHDVTSTVRSWTSNSSPNYGFVLHQDESTKYGTAYESKFYSDDYNNGLCAPALTINFDQPPSPGASVSGYGPIYAVGDEVLARVNVSTAYPSDINGVCLGVNQNSEGGRSPHGLVGWWASNPGTGWTAWSAGSVGGYYAYANAGSGYQYITPVTSSFTINSSHTTFSAGFTINDNWGVDNPANYTGNYLDTYLSMGGGSWTSGWVSQATNVNVKPKPITGAVIATPSSNSSWFIGSGTDDNATMGRGQVALNWNPAPGAVGYYIYMFDGAKYDQVASTSATTWTTANQSLFPSGSTIRNTISQGFSGNPFTSANYGSLDLRDNPNELYNKMLPSDQSTSDTAYYFRVIPYNGAGSAANSDTGAMHLPGRSVATDDAVHTTTGLGGWDSHSLACQLDSGALTANVTDLSVASLGRAATVSRSYLSTPPLAKTRFAPGWFFNFDQNLDLSHIGDTPGKITYTDADNVQHVFYRSTVNSPWQAPNGLLATLAASGTNWKLSFNDQHILTFDSSGRLVSEAANAYNDTNAINLVTYSGWGTSNLTITAANGQQIVVALNSSGQVTSASYATSDGTRTVTYSTAAPWQVTSYPNTSAARTVSYSYAANGHLSAITQANWPSSGNSVALQISYDTSNRVREVEKWPGEIGQPDR